MIKDKFSLLTTFSPYPCGNDLFFRFCLVQTQKYSLLLTAAECIPFAVLLKRDWKHGRPHGEQNGHFPLLEIWTKNQKFLKNLIWAIWIRLIDLIHAVTVCLPVWYWYCTRARFTVLDELVVHLCPDLCLQKQVVELANGLFYDWALLPNNYIGNKSSRVHFRLLFWAFCRMWLFNADILAGNAQATKGSGVSGRRARHLPRPPFFFKAPIKVFRA